MTRRSLRLSLPTLLAATLVAAPGCDDAYDDGLASGSEQLATDLEKDFGGEQITDELPAFDVLDADSVVAPESDVADPHRDIEDSDLATLDSVTDTAASDRANNVTDGSDDRWVDDSRPTDANGDIRPDAYHVQLVWGMFHRDDADAERDARRDWSGELSVNRGGIIVRQTIRFEDGDYVERDDRRDVVIFRSITGAGHDGLRLTVIDPNPELDEPIVLSYRSRNNDGTIVDDSEAIRIDVQALAHEPMRIQVDDLGNQFVAVALRRPRRDACAHGFLKGRWHQVAERGGVLFGQVRGARGRLIGHMRGLYGVRDSGERVFFGKYINLDGEFRGLFRGSYDDGNFEGRWIHRSGDVGKLGGKYDTTRDGDRLGGFYLGRWAETSCAADGN